MKSGPVKLIKLNHQKLNHSPTLELYRILHIFLLLTPKKCTNAMCDCTSHACRTHVARKRQKKFRSISDLKTFQQTPITNIVKSRLPPLWGFHLYCMQIFSVDTTIFKKKLPSKVAKNKLGWAVFSTANRPKNSPNLKFGSIKISHYAIYVWGRP